MEKISNINTEMFENPIFKDEEQEFKRKNELDSLSLTGLAISATGINYINPGILSLGTFYDNL